MGQTVETLVVPATEDGLRRATAALEAFAVRQALPDEPRRRFLLALDELFSNIVRHGRPDPATIGLRFSWSDQVLEMALTDSAGPFNPLDRPAPDTTSPLEARQPGGVGIALVRAFMDDVRYERRDGHNVVTLSARLPSKTAGE